ncbi:MAG: hypothetical protein EKK61_03400 [Rickettsiales bacterium]|nr:MAG: hypothetical protein EKK61_03400 [Rickettsiales bacterium]
MITLLASIAGFISSIVPEIIKYFKDANDKKHELNIFDRQIEYNKLNQIRSMEEIHVNRDALEQASLYSTYTSNIKWVDTLNGSVRPVLAYSFFLMYVSVKYLQYKAITESAYIIEYLEVIWSIDDQAIFAGIISFYYGQRTFRNFWKNK